MAIHEQTLTPENDAGGLERLVDLLQAHILLLRPAHVQLV